MSLHRHAEMATVPLPPLVDPPPMRDPANDPTERLHRYAMAGVELAARMRGIVQSADMRLITDEIALTNRMVSALNWYDERVGTRYATPPF